MPKTHNSPALTLAQRREQILARLQVVAPDEIAALRTVDAAIAALTKDHTSLYSGISGSSKAITACLKHNMRFLSKKSVVDQLFEGGFDLEGENAPRLLHYVMSKGVQRGTFVEDHDGLLGLPEFPNPTPMTPQRKEYLRTRKTKST